MNTDNIKSQLEEVQALSSIYDKDWFIESRESRSYSIKITEENHEVILYVTMSDGYPSENPPMYELSAPWMNRKAKQDLHYRLNEIYLENIGQTVIFQWIGKIKEVLQVTIAKEPSTKKDKMKNGSTSTQLETKCPEITHGEVIVDRKSSFQGHAAKVHNIDDVNAVLAKLKTIKKLQQAKHNMYAYRFLSKTSKATKVIQECDDDGERQGGSRMLHLLQMMEQINILVVVTRWYGGIQLGSDRFRHINNATRQVIQQAGLLKKRQEG